jgi:hypothetical protein
MADEPLAVERIRSAAPSLLRRFSDIEIETLWKRYSSDYGASFLIVSERALEDFRKWLEE